MKNIKNALKVLGILATISLVAPASAAIITYDNLAGWTAAVAGSTITTDGFNNNMTAVGNAALTFDSGVISTNSGGSPCCGDNGIDGNVYENAVDGDGTVASTTITWDFPIDIIGFGFDALSIGSGTVYVSFDDGSGASEFFLFDIGGANGFAGFVATDSFNQIVFMNATNTVDLFDIDNLVFAEASDVASVSAPTNIALLAVGLLGLCFSRRKMKA